MRSSSETFQGIVSELKNFAVVKFQISSKFRYIFRNYEKLGKIDKNSFFQQIYELVFKIEKFSLNLLKKKLRKSLFENWPQLRSGVYPSGTLNPLHLCSYEGRNNTKNLTKLWNVYEIGKYFSSKSAGILWRILGVGLVGLVFSFSAANLIQMENCVTFNPNQSQFCHNLFITWVSFDASIS